MEMLELQMAFDICEENALFSVIGTENFFRYTR